MAAFGSWLTLLRILLSLAANVAGIVRTKQAMDAGARAEANRQITRALVEIARKAGVADKVRDEITGMTDDALDEELRGP